MRSVAIISSVLSCAISLSLLNVQAQDNLTYTKTLTTTSGKIRGLKGEKVDKYLGIPYGEAERFKPSQLHANWSDVKDTVSFGQKCISLHMHTPLVLPEESEDCLNLNIYVPVRWCTSFPVVVWIHGGLFLEGSGQDQDGSRLAIEGNVIVVTINYRLGIFGFFDFLGKVPKIKNMGLLDQITALKWVNKNIVNFGGDVNRITLMGSSTGSISASLLSLSPKADKLFNNVILMSGFVNPFFTAQTSHYFPTSIRLARLLNALCGNNRTKYTHCTSKKITPETWITFQQDIFKHLNRWYHPTAINAILPTDDPELLRDQKKFHRRNVLLGFNNQDGSFFTNLQNIVNSLTGPMQTDISELQRIIPKQHYSKALKRLWNVAKHEFPKVNVTPYFERITDLYYNDSYNSQESLTPFIEMLTDVYFKYPALKMANAFYEKNASVYLYQFEHRQKLPDSMEAIYGSLIKSYHGAAKPFVFGDVLQEPSSADEDKRVSKDVIKMWANFAKTGDPNGPKDNVTWQGYSTQNPFYLVIGSELKTSYKVMDQNRFNQLDKIFTEIKVENKPLISTSSNTTTTLNNNGTALNDTVLY